MIYLTVFSFGTVVGSSIFYYLMCRQAKAYDRQIAAYEQLTDAQNDLLEKCIVKNEIILN